MPAIVAKTDFCHTGVQNLYDLQQCRFRDGVVSKLKTLGTCCIDHAFSPDGELMCLELESKVLQMLRVADSSLLWETTVKEHRSFRGKNISFSQNGTFLFLSRDSPCDVHGRGIHKTGLVLNAADGAGEVLSFSGSEWKHCLCKACRITQFGKGRVNDWQRVKTMCVCGWRLPALVLQKGDVLNLKSKTCSRTRCRTWSLTRSQELVQNLVPRTGAGLGPKNWSKTWSETKNQTCLDQNNGIWFELGPYGSIWLHIKTKWSHVAQDHF